MAEENTPAPAETPAPSEPSLIPKSEAPAPTEPKLVDAHAGKKVEPNPEYGFDKRLYTEDGKFNQDGAKAYLDEIKDEKSNYEKRILDLRRKVSDGKAPEKESEYFLDYAPQNKKYEQYFDPAAPSAKEIANIQGQLAGFYHKAALTKRQAEDMTEMMLSILDYTGVIDARSQAEKHQSKGEWIEKQKKELGSNADNIIREAKLFVETASVFSAETKNKMMDLMETGGASIIDMIFQIKEAYSGGGHIPSSVAGISGLPSDAELRREYLDGKTSDERRNEITYLRQKSGRKGKLMDASFG